MIALLFFALGLIPTFFMFHSMRVRQMVRLHNAQLEHEYQRIRDVARIKSHSRLTIENLNSMKDLEDLLAGNDSK